MNSTRFFYIIFILFACFSCSMPAGLDGEMGPQGPQGVQGIPGVQPKLFDFTLNLASPTPFWKLPFTLKQTDVLMIYVKKGQVYLPLPFKGEIMPEQSSNPQAFEMYWDIWNGYLFIDNKTILTSPASLNFRVVLISGEKGD